MNERRLTFSARQALAIAGSAESVLYKTGQELEAEPKALRKQDRLIIRAVDGKRTLREVVSAAGLEFEPGLHSVAWLILTGFLYSSDTVRRLLQKQAERLALFAELFSDREHQTGFWEDQVAESTKPDSDLSNLAPGISWEGLWPSVSKTLPSPAILKEYFLRLFVMLYDQAEKIFGTRSLLAKRILLDVKPKI